MISKGWVGQNTYLALTTEAATPSPVCEYLPVLAPWKERLPRGAI